MICGYEESKGRVERTCISGTLQFIRHFIHVSLAPCKPHIIPGITAFLPPTFSLPNLCTYHLFACSALGNIVATSFITKFLAGTQPAPHMIQNPVHSTHSQK